MKLANWLSQRSVSQQAFAEMIGSSQPQVARFAAGTRIPNREVMGEIVRVTAGAVTPGDFYEPAADAQPEAAA